MSDKYIDSNDLFVKRDETGELLPVEVQVPNLGTALVKPMVYGSVEKVRAGMSGTEAELEADLICTLLKEHYVRPDMGDLTVSKLQNDMKPIAAQSLLLGLFRASGIDGDIEVDDEGNPQLYVEGNL